MNLPRLGDIHNIGSAFGSELESHHVGVARHQYPQPRRLGRWTVKVLSNRILPVRRFDARGTSDAPTTLVEADDPENRFTASSVRVAGDTASNIMISGWP